MFFEVVRKLLHLEGLGDDSDNLLTLSFVDVGVVDLGAEEDFRRHHGVLFRQEKLASEQSAFIRRLQRASKLHVDVSEIVFDKAQLYRISA